MSLASACLVGVWTFTCMFGAWILQYVPALHHRVRIVMQDSLPFSSFTFWIPGRILFLIRNPVAKWCDWVPHSRTCICPVQCYLDLPTGLLYHLYAHPVVLSLVYHQLKSVVFLIKVCMFHIQPCITLVRRKIQSINIKLEL